MPTWKYAEITAKMGGTEKIVQKSLKINKMLSLNVFLQF